jgi:aquaporin TIP
MASNLSAHLQRSFSAPALRSYFAEFISTFLFVFATVGSTVSASPSNVLWFTRSTTRFYN